MWFYYSISPQSRRSTSKVSSKPLSLLMATVEPRQLNDALEPSLSMTGRTGAPANGGQHSRSVKDLGGIRLPFKFGFQHHSRIGALHPI